MTHWTTQELFSTAFNHFVRDGQPFSYHADSENCYYRGSKKAPCLIGLAITDEEYDVGMEGKDVQELSKLWPYLGVLSVPLVYLDIMQTELHDIPARNGVRPGSDELRHIYRAFAIEHHLDIPR